MNRTILITGGTRGIGLGIARALANSSTNLILCGRRDVDTVRNSIESLESLGARVAYIQADLASKQDRMRLIEEARASFNALHVLVNNAGMAPRERNNILDATEESFEEVLRVNLQGPYFLTQQCAKWMIEYKKEHPEFDACVININSISSTVASVSRGEYCISKAGLAMSTRLWAVGLAPHDIPVYEIRPGLTMTDMTAGVKEIYDQRIEAGLLLQPRWGTPADVGKATRMLIQGDLPYSTGQVLMLDGGLTIERL